MATFCRYRRGKLRRPRSTFREVESPCLLMRRVVDRFGPVELRLATSAMFDRAQLRLTLQA